MTAPAFTNPYRIRAREVAEREGLELVELLESATFDGVAPACCTEGCEVEPDGRCEHGCPSILLAVGMI
jgi:hypothetical protein